MSLFSFKRRRSPCHTVTAAVDERANRIDTAAYASGVLTTLGLEGTDRWSIQTGIARSAAGPADAVIIEYRCSGLCVL